MRWRRWLTGQLIGAAVMSLLLWSVSPVWSYSALLGYVAVAIPAGLFALRVIPRIGEDSSNFLRHAVIGEVLKLGLTGAICALVFITVEPLAAGMFFAGMIVAMAVGWSGLARGF